MSGLSSHRRAADCRQRYWISVHESVTIFSMSLVRALAAVLLLPKMKAEVGDDAMSVIVESSICAVSAVKVTTFTVIPRLLMSPATETAAGSPPSRLARLATTRTTSLCTPLLPEAVSSVCANVRPQTVHSCPDEAARLLMAVFSAATSAVRVWIVVDSSDTAPYAIVMIPSLGDHGCILPSASILNWNLPMKLNMNWVRALWLPSTAVLACTTSTTSMRPPQLLEIPVTVPQSSPATSVMARCEVLRDDEAMGSELLACKSAAYDSCVCCNGNVGSGGDGGCDGDMTCD